MSKKIRYSSAILVLFIVLFLYGGITSLSSNAPVVKTLSNITPDQIPYLTQAIPENRGKILAVVTSTDRFKHSRKATGYELTELSRAYYIFTRNGFAVDIASPLGGTPPVIIDKEDMGPFDYAFLNDEQAQKKVRHSLALSEVTSADYQAVYFIGGKGAMFDFPDNAQVKRIVKEMHESQKVVGAICHGPAALVNVILSDGSYFLTNKQVSGFTNAEELFLLPNAKTIFPFLLEDKLREQGANVNVGQTYLAQVSHDGALITGQNPWSVWITAESIIKQLGYQPVARKITPTEHTNNVLNNYYQNGYAMAKNQLIDLTYHEDIFIDKELFLMHSLVAAMHWEISDSINILRLLYLTRS